MNRPRWLVSNATLSTQREGDKAGQYHAKRILFTARRSRDSTGTTAWRDGFTTHSTISNHSAARRETARRADHIAAHSASTAHSGRCPRVLLGVRNRSPLAMHATHNTI
jgi:hypothetical protein